MKRIRFLFDFFFFSFFSLLFFSFVSGEKTLFSYHDPFQPPFTFGQVLKSDEKKPYDENPIIFGTDLLGWGVDIRKGVPEDSLLIKCFTWSHNDQNFYIYPLQPNITFRVPDDTYTRTVTRLVSYSEIFEKGMDYTDFLRIRMGLSLGSSSTKGFDDPSGESDSSEKGTDGLSNSFPFSGDVNVNYIWNRIEKEDTTAVINSLECGLYQISMGPTVPLTPYMVNATLKAASDAVDDGNSAYARFFDRHGTHYVESAVVGGYIEMTSFLDRDSYLDSDDLLITANFQFKKLFGLDNGNANLNISYNSKLEEFQKNATNWMRVLGGDPNLTDFFSGNKNSPQTFEEWYKSLLVNPVVIRYRLREISWLFGSYRKNAHNALTLYLSGDLDPFSTGETDN